MNKIFLFFICIFLSTGLLAQLSFGPKIGYNSAKLSLDSDEITSDLKNNFQYGIFVRIGTKIYIQPELYYVTQGSIFKTPANSTLSEFNQEVKLKTIQMPLMIGFKLINLKLFNFRIFAGPTGSLVAKTKIDNKLATDFEPIKEADLKDVIWSIQAGVGIDITKITFDIRYNFGINNLIETITIDGNPINFNSKTNGFNVTLGLKIL